MYHKEVKNTPDLAPVAIEGGQVFAYTNSNILSLVLSGEGGFIDTACTSCPADDLNLVSFPRYMPPFIEKGILTFPTDEDFNNFLFAANLMEDIWIYSETNYEDTIEEIYHLGEESLNALDSAMGFKSLRSIYENNDFLNSDWRDTASISLEDDDMNIVLNALRKVKIGSRYYKYI